MLAPLLALGLFGLHTATALPTSVNTVPVSAEDRCSQLWESAPANLASLEVYYAGAYAEGTNFTEPSAIAQYSASLPNMPAFCRFGAYIHTSNASKTQFEVFLPTDTWNGRWAMVGNGGDAGGINYPDMRGPIKNYGFAVSSTDAGHNGSSGDGTFAISAPQVQIDFGYRAVHLTAEYSKKIVELFYSTQPEFSYWFGCSSGGKQGLKELQTSPDTFDGVIAGAAAQWWPHLNGQTYRINAFVNVVNSTGYLNTTDYALIGKQTFAQCDELDGLQDGIIADPTICHPDLSSIICSDGKKVDGCILQEQADTMHQIWANWTSTEGEWLFPGFQPGAEASPAFSVTGVPYVGPGPDYYNYQILNRTSVQPFSVNETELERLVKIADETDPGQTNAIDGYIQPFLKRGKLLTYVGLADTLIPTGSTTWYYEHVRESLGYPKDLSDSYRMFNIPGMGHCSGGNAAFNVGGPGQRPDVQNGTSTSAVFDREHDMILSMMAWVEEGIAPDVLIGSKYVQNDRRLGVQFQRKLCPYPQQGVYVGGDANSADSFECK